LLLLFFLLVVTGDLVHSESDGPRIGCIDMFALDVMFDRHGRPWVLEINYSPQIHSHENAPVHTAVRTSLFDAWVDMTK
jgi:hypothetical protein